YFNCTANHRNLHSFPTRRSSDLETQVKRGVRIVHGNKNSAKSWGETTFARAVQDAGFKNCCLRSGRYDGSLRNHFFPRIIRAKRSEEHTSELQSLAYLVCRLLLE